MSTSMSFLLLSCIVIPIAAFCECGYFANITIAPEVSSRYTFTDVIESDFMHELDISADTDWIRQAYQVAAPESHNYLGMNFTLDNFISNPILKSSVWSGPGVNGGDPGLHLRVVGGLHLDALVPSAELDSSRADLQYGTYRFGMKVPSIAGTCTSVYWYYNESQEIDIEILSSQFDFENKVFPVNLVVQSRATAAGIYNTVGNGNYLIANLSFDPTLLFHDYRIDFVPGNVIFYADDVQIGLLNSSAIPTQAGHLVIKHWSNGDPGWTHGPPLREAIMSVSYVKGYFNSTNPARQLAASLRCPTPSTGSYCPISSQPYNESSPQLPFFYQKRNMTNNQIIFGKNSAISTPIGVQSPLFLIVYISTITTLFFLWPMAFLRATSGIESTCMNLIDLVRAIYSFGTIASSRNIAN